MAVKDSVNAGTVINYQLVNPAKANNIRRATIQDFGSLCYVHVWYDWSTKAFESVYRTLLAAKQGYSRHYQNKNMGCDKPIWEQF